MKLPAIVLAAALTAGISYLAAGLLAPPFAVATVWKGAGVGLLVVFAALQARSLDGWLLAGVMLFGMLGDVLLETSGFIVGGSAFFVGHLVAIALYLRHRRAGLIGAEWVVAGALAVLIPLAAFGLPVARPTAGPVALYAAGLGLMAATAWLSRFPRTLTTAGAIMFVISDLLIFARAGRPALSIPPVSIAVWSLYFAGQTLIALGVRRRLDEAADVTVRPALSGGAGAPTSQEA